MSRIYAAGVEATAKANILSDLAAYLTYNAQGELVLDTLGLTLYLRTQFALLSAEAVAPADASSVTAAAAAINVGTFVGALNATIGVGHWNGRSDWPTSTSTLAGNIMVASVMSGMAECKNYSDALSNYFNDAGNNLAKTLTDRYAASGIDALVPLGVVRDVRSRTVLYTYVNDRNEESAPSDPSALVDLDQNDTATYGAAAPPAGRNIDRVRWYRSQTTNSGALIAGFVAEVAIATALTYLDSKKDEELEEPCPTIAWDEPPVNLQGLVPGVNGGMAGFFDNTLCPCVNNVPYAWRTDDRKTVGWPIVGLGTFDDTYVVLTRGKPYYVSGADSQSLTVRMIDSNQPCTSRRSIVSVEGGVIYASADGLCMATASGVRVISEPFHTREQWWQLHPETIIAAEVDGVYIFQFTVGGTNYGSALDLRAGKLTSLDLDATAFYRDLVTDTLYYSNGTAIKALFSASTHRTGKWRTPIIVGKSFDNFAWLQVESTFVEGAVTVRFYRDGVLTDTKVVTDRNPVRLSAVLAQEHEVEIESVERVTAVRIAGSTEELKKL